MNVFYLFIRLLWFVITFSCFLKGWHFLHKTHSTTTSNLRNYLIEETSVRTLLEAQKEKSKTQIKRTNSDFDNLRNECDGYPRDDFNYSLCEVPEPCFLGNNICNIESYFAYDSSEIYFTPECNFDGGDCGWLNFCKYPDDDGFDYTNCNATVKCLINDNNCNEIYNIPSCNFDGGDCGNVHSNHTELEGFTSNENCSSFPEDNFDYEHCDVASPCLIGNGFCNIELFMNSSQIYYSQECNYDGGDCDILVDCEYPQDLFDYSDCNAFAPCYIGNGECEPSYNISQCKYDGGDCLNKTSIEGDPNISTVVEFDYGDCDVFDFTQIGNGICNIHSDFLSQETYYSPQCNFDGGDCDWLESSCNYVKDGFDYSGCDASMPCRIGNGICDQIYNISSCNEDGGDCTYHMLGFDSAFPSISPTFTSLMHLSSSPSSLDTSRPSNAVHSEAPSAMEVRESDGESEEILRAIFSLFQAIADIIDYFLDEYSISK